MKRIPVLLATIILAACVTVPREAPVTAPTWPDRSPGLAVLWVERAPEYSACCVQAYRMAERRVRERTAGLEEPWCVVLDVDETVLSNLEYQVELVRTGSSYREETWDAWCERHAAPPVPGVIGFLGTVREMGGRIALVTNRRERLRDATEENLRVMRIPYDVLLMREEGPEAPKDKTARRELVSSGKAFGFDEPLSIQLLVGDQLGDFMPEPEGTSIPLGEFGDRFIVLPNPMYGGWAAE